jgi:hypothetical protein
MSYYLFARAPVRENGSIKGEKSPKARKSTIVAEMWLSMAIAQAPPALWRRLAFLFVAGLDLAFVISTMSLVWRPPSVGLTYGLAIVLRA